jgi:hypothetical protein
MKAGKLNSVSVFANYKGSADKKYKSSAQNFAELLNAAADLSHEVELGCHLTITSGKPLTGDKMSFVCDEKGYFRSYTEMPNFKKPEQLKALKDELMLQIAELKKVDEKAVRHLTNHHNSLTLFPHHFNVYMEIARDLKLPMRSPCNRPELRQNVYLRFLNYKLKDDIHSIDRDIIFKFANEIADYFKSNANGVLSPEAFDSRHYGPISFLPARLMQLFMVGQKRKKLDNLCKSLIDSGEKSLELLLHLAKPSGLGVDRSKEIDYPGVDRGYFDSRVLEYLSIMGYDQEKWKEIEMKTWKYL